MNTASALGVSVDLAGEFFFNPQQKGGPGGFSGGRVDKSPPINAGDTGSIPGSGRLHMPWGN